LARSAQTLGVPWIDFASLPRVMDVDAPDGGHIAGVDVPWVTEIVAREIQRLLGAQG
jgi:hypothetical protein